MAASTLGYLGYSYDSILSNLNETVNKERERRGLEVRDRKSLDFGKIL